MKCAVRYLSKSGNTEKIAKAIGEELEIEISDINSPLTTSVDVLFLGSAMYAFMLPKEIKTFIKSLDSNIINKVAVFSTTASSKKVYSKIKKMLNKKRIECLDDNFYCQGEFSNANIGKPDEIDLKNAKEFARRVVKNNE